MESMNSFEIQCITEGLQIDKAGLSTRIQSPMDKTNDFYVKIGMTQASKVAPSTSCALFWIRWRWLGIWGMGVETFIVISTLCLCLSCCLLLV